MIVSKRSLIVGGLVLLPVLFYVALGTYAMWAAGLFWWSWIFLPVCWMIAWLTAKLWKAKPVTELVQPRSATHWTARDESAAEIVQTHQNRVSSLTPKELTDPHFYLTAIQDLATDLSGHYHPQAKDPYSALKVTEVLAAVRLAVDDLEGLAIKSIPGSRLLTIGQWQQLQHAPKWVKRIQDSVWFGSILLNPANIIRYYTSKATIDPLTNEIQTEFLAVIYLRFIRQVGFYLIEMNSGRLRGGADAYRHTFGERRPTEDMQPEVPEARSIHFESVTIALVGQVSSGKSSLINRLLGKEAAASDVLPTTKKVQRYQWNLPEDDVKVELLDTPGYGEAGASPAQLAEIQSALRQADVLLLVMDAHSPAKKSDVATLDQIDAYYRDNRQLKQPKSIAVLTHVDLLSPMMQWNPPYQWQHAEDKKSKSIREAVEYVGETFSGRLLAIAPVSLENQKQQPWGVTEEVLPALSSVLPEAKSAALLRAYERELDRDRWWELLDQIKDSGMTIAKYWMESRARRK